MEAIERVAESRREFLQRVRSRCLEDLPPGETGDGLDGLLDEIATRFNGRFYRSAVSLGRFGFNWLSHAAAGGRRIPWRLPDLLASRIAVTGAVSQLQRCANRGTLLLVPTHQSHNDNLMFLHVIDRLGLPPFAWAAGLNLFRNPLLGSVLRYGGGYTVDRGQRSALYRIALRNYSAELLAEGVHSLVFPGGGRSRSGAIESKLRVGLLESALQAQGDMLKTGRVQPEIFVVPVTVTYHNVLEAPWLIDEYLAEGGIPPTARSTGPTLGDAWRFHRISFARDDGATVRFGEPMNVFGELVADAELNRSDRVARIAALQAGSSRRDAAEHLGRRIADSFLVNATVSPTQTVARALFEGIRARHPRLDLAALLAIPESERWLHRNELDRAAAELQRRLRPKCESGELALSPRLQAPVEEWLAFGVSRLGEFHGRSLIAERDGRIFSSDLRLLYYYRNRLSGYRLSATPSQAERGQLDPAGFLD